MNMQQILDLIARANTLAVQLQTILPELEQNFADAKDALSSNDRERIAGQIDALHSTTNNLAAELDALRDPPAATEVDTKPASAKRT